MSILNVNKINPVGGGSTITIAGIASVTNAVSVGNSVTASAFYGDGSGLTGAGPTLSSGSNDRVVTATGANAIKGEANLTFNGGETGDAQLTVHAAEANANSDSELILETSNDFATSVVMFKDSTAEAGSIAYNHGDNYIKLSTNGTNGGTERVRIDSSGNLKFDSGYGSVATGFGVRAWVSFNGTGTPAIRGDGGVSSVGDNAEGDYTVNFDNNMPDGNYAVAGLSQNWEGTNNDSYTGISGYTGGAAVGSYRFRTLRLRFDQQPPQFRDPPYVQLIFVR